MAGPVRVRVRSAHPLPPAQFWVVIDRADDIDVVRERIARILQTRYDAPVTATALSLSVLDFEVWDCVGDVLQDDGLVTVSMIKRRKVCEAPSENTDMVVHPDAERQIMAEAHKISLLMRSECGVQPRKTLGVKRKKPEASRFVHDISQDLEQAELDEEPDELDYEDEVDYDDVMDENEVIDEVDYDDVVDDHDELEEVVRAKDEDENQENDEEENEGEREEEESEESEDEEEESEEEEGGDEESEEEDEEEDDILSKQAIPTLDEVVKLPSSRDDASVRQRLEKAKSKKRLAPNDEEPEETGVVYVGRLPHGFFEDQLRAYFSQFGDIKRLRLSRNKNTGRSKHYGFMEFESPDVAEIVVDTMNNYLLDGHLLQLAMIPSQEVDPNLWIGANRKFRRVPMDRVERKRRSKSRSAEERAEVNRKLLQRQKKRRAALARAGIKYDFPGYQF